MPILPKSLRPVTPRALTRWLQGWTQRRRDHAFWGAFCLVLAALIAPLWVGEVPPLTDFGGHLQMVDATLRFDDLPALSDRVWVRRGWLAPNLLPARFAELLAPLATPSTALKLFLSLSILGLGASFLICARVFGRPRGLVFLALPFAWGGMMSLGLVNYVGTYPLFLTGIAAAHLTGKEGRPRHLVALGACGVAAFYMHGLGFVFVVAFSTLSAVLAMGRWRDLLRLAALLPSLTLWTLWMTGAASSGGAGTMVAGAAQRINTYPISKKLQAFHHDSLDMLVGTADTVALLGLILAWCGWALLSRKKNPGTPPVAPMGGWLGKAHRHPVWVLFSVAFLFVLLAPTYVGTVLIDTRMVTPTVLLACLLPRPEGRCVKHVLLSGWSVIVGLGLGASLIYGASLYHQREIAPLLLLLDDLPRNSRAECVGVQRVNTVFKRRPLAHNCNALLQTRRDNFAGGGFAYTHFNAIEFRPGHGYHSLDRGDWTRSRARHAWDFVVVRGAHTAPPRRIFEPLKQTSSTHPYGATWTLYRKVR